jgi:uncharacterized protein YuzB (UPF0349 family)
MSDSKLPKGSNGEGELFDDVERRPFVEGLEPGSEEDFRAFQKTCRQMRAVDYGDLIGDLMWEDEPEVQFLVYGDTWWIEICDDGRHQLVLGNQCWITGEGETLESLERKLYEFSLIS